MIFSAIKRRASAPERLAPRVPDGTRVYAIGDVHGRLDLLDRLLADIERDTAARGPAAVQLVMLGDLIDRGPDSRGVVARLRAFGRPGFNLTMIGGNHEEVLLRLLGGELGLLESWLSFGGIETLASYGVDLMDLDGLDEDEAIDRIRVAIPIEHQQFLEAAVDTLRIGDYLFVHAGIRPDVHLSMQLQRDLRWIRQPFLDDDRDHGFVVVHGHTIAKQVVERRNRIGIDTGAYATGCLTCLGLEGDQRWFLEARDAFVPH